MPGESRSRQNRDTTSLPTHMKKTKTTLERETSHQEVIYAAGQPRGPRDRAGSEDLLGLTDGFWRGVQRRRSVPRWSAAEERAQRRAARENGARIRANWARARERARIAPPRRRERSGMRRRDFQVGQTFWTAVGEWLCLDIARHAILAVRRETFEAHPQGPPWVFALDVFDAYDWEASYPSRQSYIDAYGEAPAPVDRRGDVEITASWSGAVSRGSIGVSCDGSRTRLVTCSREQVRLVARVVALGCYEDALSVVDRDVLRHRGSPLMALERHISRGSLAPKRTTQTRRRAKPTNRKETR